MTILLVRHGRTRFNDERRYQGRLDVPLSAAGAAELTAAEFAPETVCVSPLRRAQQTADIVFPRARKKIAVPEFAEMDFGAFEGRTADEMADDPAYRAWVASGATLPCPGGESFASFSARVCAAFETLMRDWQGETLAIVAHGGTLCALMDRYAVPERGYFDWMCGNGCGYRLDGDAALWRERRKLRLVEPVGFTREAAGC